MALRASVAANDLANAMATSTVAAASNVPLHARRLRVRPTPSSDDVARFHQNSRCLERMKSTRTAGIGRRPLPSVKAVSARTVTRRSGKASGIEGVFA